MSRIGSRVTTGQSVFGWLYLTVAMGLLVTAVAAAVDLAVGLLLFVVGLSWVALLALAQRLQQLEASIQRLTEELAAHVAAREASRYQRRHVDPWLAASRGQH